MLGNVCEVDGSVCRCYGYMRIVRQGEILVRVGMRMRVEVSRGGSGMATSSCGHDIAYISSVHDLADEGLPEPTVSALKLLLRRDLSCLLKHSGREAAILQASKIVDIKDHKVAYNIYYCMVK
jgi:hypothetical protein